jgi:hypothetical protein
MVNKKDWERFKQEIIPKEWINKQTTETFKKLETETRKYENKLSRRDIYWISDKIEYWNKLFSSKINELVKKEMFNYHLDPSKWLTITKRLRKIKTISPNINNQARYKADLNEFVSLQWL